MKLTKLTLEQRKQMADVIDDWCEGDCDHCVCDPICAKTEGNFRWMASDEELTTAYELVMDEKRKTDMPQPPDIINHPSHYCREDAMESIDEMILIFGKEAVKHFCLCNVWKYRYRASSKNGEEDLRKSDWYMKKYKELCDDGTATGEQIPLPL